VQQILDVFFNLAILERTWPFLWRGVQMTFALSLVIVPMGVASGLAVAMLYHLHKKWLNRLLMAYVDFFRAFPPLVLLLFIYGGLPFLGLDLPLFATVALAFLLNTSSYYGEIFRAGLESVPAGQVEAARSTGLSRWQTMVWVVLPQATRNVLPDLVSNTLEVIKLTTLASVIGFTELLNNARNAQALTYNATPVVAAALIYLIVLWPLVRLVSRLEHKSIALR
jgi:polar amino acid transport system permease protein